MKQPAALSSTADSFSVVSGISDIEMNGNNPYKSSLYLVDCLLFSLEHAAGLPAGPAANVSGEVAKALFPGPPVE